MTAPKTRSKDTLHNDNLASNIKQAPLWNIHERVTALKTRSEDTLLNDTLDSDVKNSRGCPRVSDSLENQEQRHITQASHAKQARLWDIHE